VWLLADTPNLPDCNPVLFVDDQQRLWLFWVVPVANRWEQSVLKYRRADAYDDQGRPRWAWQDSIHLVPGERFAESMQRGFDALQVEEGMWAEYALPYTRMLIEAAKDPIKRQVGWMTRTHPLRLPSGRILLPLYSDGFNAGLMAISDDEGETWRASGPIVGLGPIQPTIARKSDGTLVAYLRDSGGPPQRVLQSTSMDDGETWSPATDTSLPNPGSSLEMLVVQDGRWMLVYNDLEQDRRRLVLAASSDEGATWKTVQVLDHDPQGRHSFSYPSMIQSRDGSLHITYSHAGPDGASIKHVTVTWK
jgi:predicted neuraminidase